jgi:acetylglutamate kinase
VGTRVQGTRERAEQRFGSWAENAMITVLKLGGELLEDAAAIGSAAAAIVRLAAAGPLVVVHGGGRAIDAELRARQLEPRFVDGLRVTDNDALDVVVSVLAGRNNTALVAAIGAAGGRAVGLTGADAGIGRSQRAALVTAVSGEQVDLGLVGRPEGSDVTLLHALTRLGYVPVVASIGVDGEGALLNVNADTLAGHFAAALRADRLIIAGATAGVLREDGRTIAHLTAGEIDGMTRSGAVHSGMIAKLDACRRALEGGVADVAIVSGRGAADFAFAEGTRIRLSAAVLPQG